jgi:Kef-type K+ transport system membrane component KefB
LSRAPERPPSRADSCASGCCGALLYAGDAEHATTVLFGVAVLVLAAKLCGRLARTVGQPAVLGELLVGIGLGNLLPLAHGRSGVEFVRNDPTIRVLAHIGVLLLLFDVGLESDLRALARVGRSAFLVATIGVVVPFALGYAVSVQVMPELSPIAHVFVGASLTATSVGITARVLKDLGVARSAEGQTILGAAMLDDVFGLVILAVVTGMAAAGGDVTQGLHAAPGIVVKSTLFLGLAGLGGHFLSKRIADVVGRMREPGLMLALGVSLCFAVAFLAESLGLAGILGAFAAGVLLDPYGQGVHTRAEERTLGELLEPLSTIFVPLFFVMVGLQVDLAVLASPQALLLGGALVVVAVIGKLAAGLGVLGSGTRRIVVAIGMVPRGEVGLIFAGMGSTAVLEGKALLPPPVFSALVIMVLVTTLMTPIGLARVLRRTGKDAPV